MLARIRQGLTRVSLLTIVALSLGACQSQTNAPIESIDSTQSTIEEALSPQPEIADSTQESLETSTVETAYDTHSTIHFIDTGQSDAILIENDGHYAMIDTGDTNDDQLIHDYLTQLGVQTLDYLILTHVHADHIGAADTIIREFEVKKTFVSNDEATTKVYREYIEALAEKGLKASVPLEASVHPLGTGTLTFYNTKGDHRDTNDKSLVVLYQNGNDTALFTGDAGETVEKELPNMTIDLYKAGHHGSTTASSEAFIKRIQPKVVAITVGEGNSYYHPHHRVVQLFKQLNIPIYRTDEQGTLIFTSTGNGITTELSPASYQPGSSDPSQEKDEGSSSSSEASNSNSTSMTPEPETPNATESTSSEPVKVYQNCKELNQDYPHGINKWDHPELYEANQGRDRDKDGYACER